MIHIKGTYRDYNMSLLSYLKADKIKNFYELVLYEFNPEYSGEQKCYRYVYQGQLHREDGPAAINLGFSPSLKVYYFYLLGREYPQSEWFKKISKENQIKFLFNPEQL